MLAEQLSIRDETAADAAVVEDIHRSAFRNDPHSVHNEHAIVNALRERGALTVSLFAEAQGVVVGHIAISPVSIDDGATDWYGLGPVAVAPAQQGKGAGGLLVREALRRLRALGAAGCVVLGEPAYYARFGFAADAALAFPGPPAEYFQALHFAGPAPRGVVRYDEAFYVVAS
jgi:putative acetyltransferase